MRGLFIDLDGVLYEDDRPIQGAIDTVKWIETEGIPHLFVTNTTSRPRRALLEKLRSLGFDARKEQILTPPVAAREWLNQHSLTDVALFVPAATAEDFSGLNLLDEGALTSAQAVVIGDLADGWRFSVLNRAFRLLEANRSCALIALGMTRYWRTSGGLQLDTGPFVAALEYATGRSAEVLGKPSQTFFQMGLDLLGVEAGETVMIGDDIKGDVEAAQAAGLAGALVKTGKFKPADLERDLSPTIVWDSIADLPQWYKSHGD